MDFRRRNINKVQRNGELIAYNVSSFSSKLNGGSSSSSNSGSYLPATNNGDGTYTVNLNSVLFNGNVIAAGEVAAYLSGNTDASGSTTVGNVVIEDNLTSTATTAALSANQGRILKDLINEVSGKTSGVTSGTTGETVTEVSALTQHINDTVKHITETDRTNWNNKLNKSVWDDVFEVDSNGNLKVKVNLYGQGEISAYGSGTTGSTTEINLENYYTKDEIDDKLDNIDVGDIDLSDYSLTSHTHSNYVSTVKVGTTNYNVSANTISLPAYPTLSTLGAASSTNLNNHTGNTTAHITATERTNWNKAYTNNHTHSNKTVLDKITDTKLSNWDNVVSDWNDVFEIDTNGNLRVKVNLYGDKEISAYGSGASGGTTEINLENYYTKSEIDDILDNIDVGDIDLSEYSKTSHTHSNYALSNHTHTNYSVTSHTHAQYASSSHTHPISAITSLQTTLDGKSGTGHSHSNYSLTSHSHSNYSLTSHTHSQYASSSHTHSQYASSSHTHPISAITSLQTTLDGKSGTGHSHSNYSVTSHTHNYAGSSSAGGAATSANKVNSTLSWSGYASGSFNGSSTASFTIPSNTNQLTNGAGFITSGATVAKANQLTNSRTLWGQSFNGTANVSGNMTGVGSISASGNITTSAEVTAHSDKRLKDNIQPLTNRGYITPTTYIKDGKESIGFIAQDMQKLYPELVTVDESTEEKYLTVNYMQYTAVLESQIIELSKEIQELKDKLNDIYNKE